MPKLYKKAYKTRRIKHPKTPIAIDFDGVIHAYSKGFLDGSIYDKPVNEAGKTLKKLRQSYFVYIFSSRSKSRAGKTAIVEYLKKYKIPYDKVVSYKPPAKFYIDDRAIRFQNWKQAIRELSRFEKEIAGAKP